MTTSGWRVVSETVKQKWKVSVDRTFKPTSNARNEAMFRDATQFADRLRKFKKDMQSWQKRIEGSFTEIRTTMESTLPQAYDIGHDGRPAPISEPKLIGAGVDTEMLAATSQDYSRRVQEEVVRPVKEWLHAYASADEAMKSLESMRLDLDSRRRTVGELQGRYERQQSFTSQQPQPTTPPPSPRQINDMQQTYSKMRHKEDKLQTAQHQYEEAEAAVWDQLRSLVEATASLRDYMIAFIAASKDCFTHAYNAFIPNPNQSAMLPQNMAGLRINTTPKGSPYSGSHAQTPTKKLLAQVATAMMGAAKKTKDMISTPRAHPHTPSKAGASPFKPDPYASPLGTPTSTNAYNPYFKESVADPYSVDPYAPAPYSKSPGTPHANPDYHSPKVDPYSGQKTPSGKESGVYTPKDGYPSPIGHTGMPKGGDLYSKGGDQFGSNDPYSNYQPAAPKWSPSHAEVPAAGHYVY